MKITEFISGGFYINLSYRKDRNEHIKNELSQHELLPFIKRFDAVKAFDRTEHIRDDEDKMLKASTAASSSHRKIVEIAKNNNWDNVLIFEDDAQFFNTDKYTGIKVVEKALDQLKSISNWEIYYLGANLCDNTLNKVTDNLIKCDCCYSLQAYILNKNTFDKILQEDLIIHMDLFLNRTFSETFITYPLALVQKEQDVSDIGGHRTVPLEFWRQQYNKPFTFNE